MKSMSAKMAVDLKLEQDSMEGVDEAEWEQWGRQVQFH